jgi:hypothetical protein
MAGRYAKGTEGTYATAIKQIRALLAARSQAEPIMQAKHVSVELTCWPIPPLRTIRRYMEQMRKESEIGHRGQKTRRAA